MSRWTLAIASRAIDAGSARGYGTLQSMAATEMAVDEIAAHLVGMVLLANRKETAPMMDRWIQDDDLWIRRTALISQLRHKDQTDHIRLFRYSLAQAGEKDFFIRKAIGWALRQYAYTAPDRVRALDDHAAGGLAEDVRQASARYELGADQLGERLTGTDRCELVGVAD